MEQKQKRTYKGKTRRLATGTHCANGHPWTEESTYTPPNGQKKVCKLCQRQAFQRYHGRPETDAPIGPRNADKTHCPWGHEYSEENTYFTGVKTKQRHCKVCSREHRLMRTYGLARGEYDRRFAEQDGGCAICRKALEDGRNLHVDHDHATGAVRALLCTSCNNLLGRANDDPALLRAAADYLDAHATPMGA